MGEIMDKAQIEELRKLKTLLNEGIITKEEFNEARDNLLKAERKEPPIVKPNEDDFVDISYNVETVEDEPERNKNDALTSEETSINGEIDNTNNGNTIVADDKAKGSTGPTNKIIIGIVILVVVIIGAVILNESLSTARVNKDLPGEWVYDSSYTNDSEDSYDAKLDSSISFSDDGEVVIQIDDCKCKGTWSVSKNGEYYYIYVSDYDISGESDSMQQIIDSLTYREFSDGVNLYWYVGNDSETTNWHYYRHK